ncbi:hypothetical protein [Streptomyces shenzhenensis]|uniref:Uncharacterized protein n=1 Tax=Streptomyces shenzhenensis TaxID=943815 RepID=A0A3M0IAN8_9ACTN|nr:hypothetical protein [Streptomyces shenzhenensis]RMB86611.1 hypothetical protein CTZ28_05930 [Streptomyces shenzhenensis]
MPWTRGLLSTLAVCVLLLTGATGCGTGEAREGTGARSSAPAGRLLDKTDDEGRRYREAPAAGAPDIDIEVTPDAAGGWDVRLTVRAFRFSPDEEQERAHPGRGLANLFVDGEPVARLRTPRHHLAAHLLPKGTHQVTARLYADDGTVWAVHGKPVESTADVTASGAETAPAPTMSPGTPGGKSGTAG